MKEFDDLVDIISRLRKECPWDREQTHESLAKHLIEEPYELLDALAAIQTNPENHNMLNEELGDLLLQILLHSKIAEENKYFSIGSAITYTRRYMLLGAYGLGQADDEADAWSQQAADSDNTGKARKSKNTGFAAQKVTTTLAPEGKTKLSQDEFDQLRAELNSRPDKAEIMKNFKKTYFPSKDKVLATDIEFKEHESYIRKFMV